MVNTRIRYFDVAKGLTILCVILSHSAIEAQSVAPSHIANTIISVCFSFHMPLFFILSGYFMHLERDFRWAKEAKQLLCTYLLTSAAVLLGVTCVATIDHGTRKDVLRQWGDAVLYGSGDISDLTLWPVQLRIGAIWFLLSLFWAHLLLHIFARLPYTPGCVSGWPGRSPLPRAGTGTAGSRRCSRPAYRRRWSAGSWRRKGSWRMCPSDAGIVPTRARRRRLPPISSTGTSRPSVRTRSG